MALFRLAEAIHTSFPEMGSSFLHRHIKNWPCLIALRADLLVSPCMRQEHVPSPVYKSLGQMHVKGQRRVADPAHETPLAKGYFLDLLLITDRPARPVARRMMAPGMGTEDGTKPVTKPASAVVPYPFAELPFVA